MKKYEFLKNIFNQKLICRLTFCLCLYALYGNALSMDSKDATERQQKLTDLGTNLNPRPVSDTFPVKRWRTKKGSRVAFYQSSEVPMLNIHVAFAAGSGYDGKHFGLSALTTALINQGNAGLSETAIAKKLADVGAQFDKRSGRDQAVFSLKTLSSAAELNKAVDTFGLILGKPDFVTKSVQRELKQQLTALIRSQEVPEELANMALFQKLYGTHPYAHSILGNPESLRKMTTQDIQSFYKKHFVASNAVVVIVGDVSQERATRIAEQLTQYLPQGEPTALLPDVVPIATEKNETVKIPFPSKQTLLRLGQIGIDHRSRDYFDLTVGNYILGGGTLVSRLSNEVREKRGLSYGVGSQWIPMMKEGPFLISLATQASQAKTALKITQETVARFVEQGPSETELQAAKKYLCGSFPVLLSSNANIAQVLLQATFYGLPNNYLETYRARVNAVTVASIQKALKKHLFPEKMLLVAVGEP